MFGAVRDVSGRVIVVHADGARVACGVISPYGHGRQEVLQMGLHPSAASSAAEFSPAGIVVERDTDDGLHIKLPTYRRRDDSDEGGGGEDV